MPSSPASRPTPERPRPARTAREGNRGTALSPAWPTHTPGTGSSAEPLPDLAPHPTTQASHPAREGQPGQKTAPNLLT
jgi:hypothetical protein